jgi:hypothetical protein
LNRGFPLSCRALEGFDCGGETLQLRCAAQDDS